MPNKPPMVPSKPPLGPQNNNGEETTAERRNRRMSRQRTDSEGSTRGAFSLNPMPEPYARRKRAGNNQQTSTTSSAAAQQPDVVIDFTSAVNMAIAQEGGQEVLVGLVDLVGQQPVRKKGHARRSSSQDASLLLLPLGNDETSALVDGQPKVAQAGGNEARLKYGTMHDEISAKQMESSLAHLDAPSRPAKRQLSTIRDTSMHSATDFLDDETFNLFSQVRPAQDFADSLRLSDRSAEVTSATPDIHRNLMGGSFLGVIKEPSRRKPPLPRTRGSQRVSLENADGKSVPDTRKDEIDAFSRMVQAPVKAPVETVQSHGRPPVAPKLQEPDNSQNHVDGANETEFIIESVQETFMRLLDPTPWLEADGIYPEEGVEGKVRFPEDSGTQSLRGFVRTLLYNPVYPEFTSLQQFVWSIIIGVTMGFYTAGWKFIIEGCVGFFWEVIPALLRRVGFFTDLDGSFPMTHYMWICPTIFGCVLSYIFASLSTKIPGQNEWIRNVHSKGVQEYDTFWQLIVLSTMGMASGMSLGPELPLVLTAGMAGSYLGILTKQSVLQARVLNLVAASSAVGGFFGFPMAGALFVLEIPHRMGLQYFEALSPAIFGSIVAVLTNRMVVKNDVTGYYQYPFLTGTLPSTIFWHAIIFGLFGTFVGIGYAKGVLKLKAWVHDIFHEHEHHESTAAHENETKPVKAKPVDEEQGFSVQRQGPTRQEFTPLVGKPSTNAPTPKRRTIAQIRSCINRLFSFNIKQEPRRAAVSGAIAGFLVGITGMLVPHSLFWGEAQLQNLIDKGRTPLPIFGRGNDPTADLTAWGYCMLDPDSGYSYSMECSALIALSKIFVTGLSLGTGIIGGHFWGPLFTGCIASHFFVDFGDMVSNYFGFVPVVGAYPCVAILCTMGATHVVTFRAHTAIMLILTLTISAFNPENSTGGFVAGDYSAVFPLLVVAVYVSLMISRDHVKFYDTQRSRGDIMALPEVLCEPGKQGAPMIVYYDIDGEESILTGTQGGSTVEADSTPENDGFPDFIGVGADVRVVPVDTTMEDIERRFNDMNASPRDTGSVPAAFVSPADPNVGSESIIGTAVRGFSKGLTSSRLDQLLSNPVTEKIPKSLQQAHRRIKSASAVPFTGSSPNSSSSRPRATHRRTQTSRGPSAEGETSRPGAAGTVHEHDLIRVSSYGEVQRFQPSLIDQARARASSLHRANHRRIPSQPRSAAHSRANSKDSDSTAGGSSNWLQTLVSDIR